MEGLFEKVAATVSFFSGIISLYLVMVTVIRSYFEKEEKLKKAEEKTIYSVLEEDDINKLGAYVDDVIGSFDMREYATNPEVERKVDSYIEKIQDYIGAPEDIEREKAVSPPQPDLRTTLDSQLPHDFKPILQELRFGESWNALARLRRYIEVILRKKVAQANLSQEEALSVGRLLTLLEKRELIDPKIAHNLRYPISVSNRAIHGQDVSQAEAEEVIFYAGRILQSLEI